MIERGIEERVTAPRLIDPAIRREMFALFKTHYDAVQQPVFEADLSEKDFVILLRRTDGPLLGFTTLAVREMPYRGRMLRYVFSGDTVMDARHWGKGQLLKSWFRLAGRIKGMAPRRKLYWFLIVKGHRTYRILENFFVRYAPGAAEPDEPVLISLRNALARNRFGDAFDAETGLIEFPQSRGHLARHLQDAEGRAGRPLVRAFLKLNPDYANGVELACIAELSRANMKSYAAIEFGKGLALSFEGDD